MEKLVHIFCGPKLSDLQQQSLLNCSRNFLSWVSSEPITGEVEGLDGVRLDFNVGLRLQIPAGNWHVTIRDSSSGIVFFDEDVSNILLTSAEKFFIPWEVELSLDGASVFSHRYSAEGQLVCFHYFTTGMGDHIILFTYMEKFRRVHRCRVSCFVAPYLRDLIRSYYPEIECYEEGQKPQDAYATYYMAPNFNPVMMSEEIRTMPMEYYGRELLGLQSAGKIVYRPKKPRQIREPYVCIGVQASNTFKAWLNPTGWDQVVRYLKQLGYRVLCIDQNREETDHGNVIRMPDEAEDFTGTLPLHERVELLAYADFFIGLSSGLSWLAWAADIPVIMISGITAPWFEFIDAYRVYNRLVCHGCHNDTRLPWPEYETCPYHKGTERAYECSKRISAQQVMDMIDVVRSEQSR